MITEVGPGNPRPQFVARGIMPTSAAGTVRCASVNSGHADPRDHCGSRGFCALVRFAVFLKL